MLAIVTRVPVVAPLTVTLGSDVVVPVVGVKSCIVIGGGGAAVCGAPGETAGQWHRDEQLNGRRVALRDRVRGNDLEVVAAASERHGTRPVAVLIGGRAIRRAIRTGDADDGAAAGGALEGDLGRVDRGYDIGRIRQRHLRHVNKAQELDAQIADEQRDHEHHQAGNDDCRRERHAPTAGLDERHGRRRNGYTSCGPQLLHLFAPSVEQIVGIEAQVDRVVTQEALRVDRRRQVIPVAVLERGEVLHADLGVALGAIQVDAFALTSELERLAHRRSCGRIDRVPISTQPLSKTQLVAGGHVV